MRNFLLLMLGLVFLSGCKKSVEQTQLDALMELITSGQWKVTKYQKGNSDITGSFGAYVFQFKKNDTVDAIKEGRMDKTGTWKGNTTNLTIESSFGATEEPLSLLNGIWQVTKTSLSFVESRQTVDGEERLLRLDKL